MIYLGKFDHDLTERPKPIDDGECKVKYPQMADMFRLVNYYNLHRKNVCKDLGERIESSIFVDFEESRKQQEAAGFDKGWGG